MPIYCQDEHGQYIFFLLQESNNIDVFVKYIVQVKPGQYIFFLLQESNIIDVFVNDIVFFANFQESFSPK